MVYTKTWGLPNPNTQSVASLGGEAERPGWHHPGGWHPNGKKKFVGKFAKNCRQTRSDR